MPEEEPDSTKMVGSAENPYKGAAAYAELVGAPRPDQLVDDEARAKDMAYGIKHLMDKAVTEREHPGNVSRLRADRLAGAIGRRYDKEQAGEVAVYEIDDPAQAKLMAEAARQAMDRALMAEHEVDLLTSFRSGERTLSGSGSTPPTSPGRTDQIIDKYLEAQQHRRDADDAANNYSDGERQTDNGEHGAQVGRDEAIRKGSAPLHEKAAEAREKGDSFMVETYKKDALRREEAHALAYDMLQDPVLADSIKVKGHTRRPDLERATVEVMAKAALHHVERTEKAVARGDHEAAAKHRTKANEKMGEAAYRADSGVDASNMVKRRWQVWK